jgi:hypothetical protein
MKFGSRGADVVIIFYWFAFNYLHLCAEACGMASQAQENSLSKLCWLEFVMLAISFDEGIQTTQERTQT